MTAGVTEKFHVAAFAQDSVHATSTVPDTTSTLVVVSGDPSIASAALDPSDPRAIVVTPHSPGNVTITVTESPDLSPSNKLLATLAISAPPPDNRRIDFVSADDPA